MLAYHLKYAKKPASLHIKSDAQVQELGEHPKTSEVIAAKKLPEGRKNSDSRERPAIFPKQNPIFMRQDQTQFSERAFFYGIAIIAFVVFVGWLKSMA